VIAIRNAGIDFLPGFVSAALVFANMSTANTSLFVASRTLYGIAVKLDHHNHPLLSVFRHTTKAGVPVAAIFASCIFAPLAYLQCGGGNAQELLGVFSQIETLACLIVWLCQCLAFIRFYNGFASTYGYARFLAIMLTPTADSRPGQRPTTAPPMTTLTPPPHSRRQRTSARSAARY